MEYLILVFSIIVIQLLILGILYIIYRNLVHPTIFFQSYMTIQVIIGIVAFKDYQFSLSGIIWILTALFFFSFGSLCSNGILGKKVQSINTKYKYTIKIRMAEKVLVISIILGCLYSIELIARAGFSLSQIINFDSLIKLNIQMATERYSGLQESSNISRVFLVFSYLAPLIGGYNLNFIKRKKSKIICWLSLFPSFLIVLVQNTKAGWIAAVFLFISGYITSKVKIHGKLPKISTKKILLIFSGVGLFLVINYVSMFMRIGSFDERIIQTVNKKFLIYSLGQIPAFDIWYANNIGSIEYSFGIKTFFGIANFVGISERIQGIYIDSSRWGEYGTNVFTAFRPFLEDFGPYMGLIIMFLYGFIINIMFVNVKKKGIGTKSIMILAAFYFYTLYSFITSTWAYTSFLFVFVLFGIYIQVVSIKINRDSVLEMGEKNEENGV